MKAVVFAAGKGERLWPLTDRTPKPLLPVGGRAMLERTLIGLSEAGIREIGIVTKYQEQAVREFVGNGHQLRIRPSFIHQDQASGTADALRSCEDWLKEEARFVVIHGDDYYSTKSIVDFVKSAGRSKDETMATAESEDPSRFGSLKIDGRKISAIQEKASTQGSSVVNAALYALKPSIFKSIERTDISARGEYELTDAINYQISSGTAVRAFPLHRGGWLGITYPWDLLTANQIVLRESVHSVGKGQIESGVRLTKPIVLGKGAAIMAGSRLEGPIIIGEGSTIGPNSYIRPFTSMGRNCKVGASCEVKASILMDDVKVPHLSYVGDSILGNGSSLGAGTITANLRFDDSHIFSDVRSQRVDSHRRKLGAILGDDVRTGINVSIFPGVKIGAGARIWPGVSLRHDVAAGVSVKESNH